MVDFRKAARRQVSEQGRCMNRFLVVTFGMPDGGRIGVRRDDLAGDQAVLTKAVNSPVVAAFEIQVAVLDKFPIDLARGKRLEIVDDRLVTRLLTWRRRQAGHQDLRGFGVTDGEYAAALDIPAGAMSRRTNEPEIVLPTHWRHHVLWRQIQGMIGIAGPDQNERRDRKELLPDRYRSINFDDVIGFRRFVHSSTRRIQTPSFKLI